MGLVVVVDGMGDRVRNRERLGGPVADGVRGRRGGLIVVEGKSDRRGEGGTGSRVSGWRREELRIDGEDDDGWRAEGGGPGDVVRLDEEAVQAAAGMSKGNERTCLVPCKTRYLPLPRLAQPT
jgi:hypothetical protein